MGYRNAPDAPGRPSESTGRAHRRFASRCREDLGQSLVVIVIAMTVIVLVAALAIDASDWFATHHKAQVTADAAALAAANYMGTQIAKTGSASSVDGTSVATTYAANNGLPINNNDVTFNGDTVTVTVPTTGPLFFAGISLGSGPSISARAVASWETQDCGTASSNCAFAYAADNVCSGNTGVKDVAGNGPFTHGITLIKTGTGSGTAIIGDVISASSINASNNGNPTYNSTAVYPSTVGGASCVGTNSPSPPPANPKPFAAVVQRAVTSAFPIDYSKIYTACGTTSTLFGTVSCVADPNNPSVSFPSYCTAADDSTTSSTVTLSSVNSNDIYCDAGTGTTTDPSTWNGTISVTAGGASVTVDATYIAGAVDFNVPSNTILGPASGNKLLAYGAECNNSSPLPTTCPATGTTTILPAVYFTSNGNATLSGDVFAPAGVIDSQFGGTPTITGFLEGWDVVYQANGTVTGQGPPVNNQGYFVGDYLIQ